MTEYTREIAKVESTSLGFEDHGILTGYLHVNYGGAAQGLGGYNLASTAGAWLQGVLRACGVGTWEQVKGRTIYVLKDPETRRIEGIEPLPTEKGKRFIFADMFPEATS
jgi:hypothetical protein